MTPRTLVLEPVDADTIIGALRLAADKYLDSFNDEPETPGKEEVRPLVELAHADFNRLHTQLSAANDSRKESGKTGISEIGLLNVWELARVTDALEYASVTAVEYEWQTDDGKPLPVSQVARFSRECGRLHKLFKATIEGGMTGKSLH